MSHRTRRRKTYKRAPVKTVMVQGSSNLEVSPAKIIIRYVSTSVQTEDETTRTVLFSIGQPLINE